jgi:predicted small lipoprotein YifL
MSAEARAAVKIAKYKEDPVRRYSRLSGAAACEKREMIRSAMVLAMVCSLTACNASPKEAPPNEHLAGDYVLSRDSRDFLQEQKSYSTVPESEISLRADGMLSIKNIPDCYVDGFGRSSNKFLSGTGRWEIQQTEAGYGVELTVGDGGSLPRAIYDGSSIEIRNKRPPFALWVSIGDPDERVYLVYERNSG